MANFSETAKAQIRMYLGYPDDFRFRNYRLESILESLSAESQTLVETALTNLAAIETQILNVTMGVAGIKRADDIEFFQGRAITDVRRLGRQYVGRISILTGVPIYSDIFGEGGYLGDGFSEGGQFGTGGGGGSGIIPLG